MFNRKSKKLLFLSYLSFLSIIFNIFQPFILSLTLISASASPVHAAEAKLETSYDQDTNSLTLSLSNTDQADYSLFYKTPEKIDAVFGKIDPQTSVYFGTCSSGVCVPQNISKLIVKARDADNTFVKRLTLNDQSLLNLGSYQDSSLDLTQAETAWLNNPWLQNTEGAYTIDRVEQNITYRFPQNNQVSVTFSSLPDNSGNLTIKEVTLSNEKVEELGALSNTAYEITSNMQDGSFEYDLTLPNPQPDQEVQVKHSEDGENFEDTGSPEQENDILKVKDLDHFTLFIVVNNDNPKPPVNDMQLIFDNSDSEYSEIDADNNWRDSSCNLGYKDGETRVRDPYTDSYSAQWQFTAPKSASYKLSASWSTHSNRTERALYTVKDSGDSVVATTESDQTGANCTDSNFVDLSTTVSLTEGETYTIELTNPDQDGYLIADAVRLTSVEAPSEVWVDDAWSGSSEGDELSGNYFGYNAFATIQEGIDQVAEGGTVNVAAGAYEEAIEINKEITLLGATDDTCKKDFTLPTMLGNYDDSVQSIIKAPGPNDDDANDEDADDNPNAVTITVPDVTLKGFVVEALDRGEDSGNNYNNLIELRPSGQEDTMTSIVIENNVIGPNTDAATQTNGRHGLRFTAGYGHTIGADIVCNKIHGTYGNGNNVFIWGTAYGTTGIPPADPGPADLSGTVIQNNDILNSARSGVECSGAQFGLTIDNNIIHDNGAGHEGEDADLKYGEGIAFVRDYVDVDHTGYTGLGANAGYVDGVIVTNNEIYDNDKNGIYMGPMNKNHTITGNDIHDNGNSDRGDGSTFGPGDGIRVDLEGWYYSNSWFGGSYASALYGSTSNITANNNTISNNVGYGAQVLGTPTNGFELNAENNYWGDPAGPSGEGNGSGDKVSTNVDFCPWLDAENGNSFGPCIDKEKPVMDSIDYFKNSNPIGVAGTATDPVYVKDVSDLSYDAEFSDDLKLDNHVFVIFDEDSTNPGYPIWSNAYCSFGGTDNTSTLSGKNDTVSGVSFTQCEGSLEDGRYVVVNQVRDKLEKFSESYDLTFAVDTQAPTLDINSIRYPDGTVKDGKFITSYNTPTILGTTSNDVDSLDLTVGGNTYSVSPTDTDWVVDTTNELSDGSYIMTVTATDLAGNTTTQEQALVVDTVAPSATHTYYKNGGMIEGFNTYVEGGKKFAEPVVRVQDISELSFTGEYQDPTPSAGLYWDSYVIFEAQDDGSFAFASNDKQSYCGWRSEPNLVDISGLSTFSLTDKQSFTNCVNSLPDGEYYLTHQISDQATRDDIPSINQFKDVLGLRFIVDSTAPDIQWQTPSDGDILSGNISLEATCDELCDYINFWWREDSQTYNSSSKRYHYVRDDGTLFDWLFTTPEATKADGSNDTIEDGTYHFYGAGKDLAGNWARTEDISVEIDNTPPAKPTGLKRESSDGETIFQCGDVVQRQVMIPVWDENTEPDFSHYEYSSFHADGSQGLNEQVLHTNRLNNSWVASSDGTYGFVVRSVDLVGNKSDWSLTDETHAGSCQITYDSQKPVTNFTNAPKEDSFYNSSIHLEGTTTDNNGVDVTTLASAPYIDDSCGTYTDFETLDNGVNDTPFDWSTNWTPDTEGSYCLKAYGTDIAGNVESSAIIENITYDTTAPFEGSLLINNNDSYTNSRDVILTISGTDAFSGVDEMSIANGSSYYDWEAYSNNKSWQLPDSDGEKTVRVKFKDSAGNENDSYLTSDTIILDRVNPTSQPTSPEPGDYNAETWDGAIQGTASDDRSHLSKVEVSIKVVTPESETKYWNGDSWQDEQVWVEANGTTAWNYTVMPIEGTYTFYSRATDNAANTENTGELTGIIYDTTPPTDPSASSLSHTTNTWSNDNTVDVEWTGADDNVSGVDGFYTEWNTSPDSMTGLVSKEHEESVVSETSTVLVDGDTHYFHIATVDNAGNWTTTDHLGPFYIDTVDPSSTITTPTNDGDNSVTYLNDWDGSVAGTASDDDSGVDYVKLVIQRNSDAQYWNSTNDQWQSDEFLNPTQTGNEFANWTFAFESSTEGIYDLTSHAFDKAGNKEDSYQVTVVYDKTIPEVDLTMNPVDPDGNNGWYETEPTITLTATDNNDPNHGFEQLEYQWNGQNDGGWTTSTNNSISDIIPPSEGHHILYYRSLDKSDNYSDTGIKNVRYDNTGLDEGPQNVSVSTNPTSNTTATVSWEQATDNVGIDKYDVIWSLDDTSTTYTKGVSGNDREAEIDQLEDGTWTITVKAYDGAGHAKSASTTLTVDQTAPSAPALNLDGTGTGTAELSWNSIDDATSYIILYGTTPGEYLYGANVGDVTSYTVQGLGAGNYYFVVKAKDAVNNQSPNSNEVNTGAIVGAPGVTAEESPAEGFQEAGKVLGEADEQQKSTESGNVLGESNEATEDAEDKATQSLLQRLLNLFQSNKLWFIALPALLLLLNLLLKFKKRKKNNV